jgi:hypothetical protein
MPQELYQELLVRLARLRSKSERLALSTGLLRGLCLSVLIVLAALGVEAVFHLGITARTILFWSTLGLALAFPLLLTYKPLSQRLGIQPRVSDDTLATRIGKHFTEVEDKLLNVFQLARELASAGTSSSRFAEAAFVGTYGSVRHLDFNSILDEKPLRRTIIFFLFTSLIAGGVFFGFRSDLYGAAERIIDHNTFYQKPAPFIFDVSPANIKVLRGESVNIVITTRGEQLQKLTLRIREEGAKEFDKLELTGYLNERGKMEFVYELRIQQNTEYYAEAREVVSDEFKVTVQDRPIIRSLKATVTPPSYTREPSRTLDENLGDITGLTGTTLSLNILSSKELRSAKLVFTEQPEADTSDTGAKTEPKQSTYQLTTSGYEAKGSLSLRKSGSYHIELLDKDSISSERPIEYTVTLSRDEDPAVALLDPGERADIPGNMRLSMLVKIHDDFGFSKLRIGYRLTKSKYVPEEKEYKWFDLPLSNYHTQDLEVPYLWNLAKIDLSPEDELAYVLEVADNDIISGPKKVRSPEYALRFPSVEEIFRRAEEQSDNIEKNLREVKQDAEELKKKIDETVDEMRQATPNEMSRKQQEFSQRKDVQDIMKRQDELNNRVSDIKKDLEKMTEQLDKQNAISPETMQKYQELQKLMDEVRTKEMEDAFRKLDQAMKNMDPKAMEQAMKEVQFNEEQFKKSLERTANILKKIKMEQKLDEMMKRTSELARNQEQTAKEQEEAASGKKPQSTEDKAKSERKQEDAKNELARLQEEAKELAKDMQKLPESMQTPEEMKEAMEAANDPSTEKAMQDAKEAMQQKQNKRAAERSKDAAAKLKNARNKMQQLKQKMQETEKQKNLADMKRIRDEMNRLSKEEESLKRRSQQAMPNSNVFRDMAAEQAERKEELGNAASQMMQLAQRTTSVTPQMGKTMGEAFAKMQEAQNAMTERMQGNAIQSTQGAMAALNKAAQETQSAMEQMQQGSSCPNGDGSNPGEGQEGGGDPFGSGKGGSAMQQFLDQIGKLTDQQMALSEQMKQMMNGQQSGGGQQEMLRKQAEAARAAAGQSAVQKTLEDLAREQKNANTGNKKSADDLKKLSEEMQELVSDMRSKGINQQTIQRQEKILSRLLEAQRSINERDKEETREANTGENVSRTTPGSLKLSEEDTRKAIREEMLRSSNGAFSKDYQILIRKYLEKIGK